MSETPTREKNQDRAYMLRCWFQTQRSKKESAQVMSTLLPVGFGDLPLVVMKSLLAQLEKKGLIEGVAGELKAKHLRIGIIMETLENKVYAVPSKIMVSKTIRKSLVSPAPPPAPFVASAVVMSVKQLKDCNKNYVDDGPGVPLDIPTAIKSFLNVSFDIRATPSIVDFEEGSNPSSAMNSPREMSAQPTVAPTANGNGGVPPPAAPVAKLPPSKLMPPKIPVNAPAPQRQEVVDSETAGPTTSTAVSNVGAGEALIPAPRSPNRSSSSPTAGAASVLQGVDCTALITLKLGSSKGRAALTAYIAANAGYSVSYETQPSASSSPSGSLSVQCVYFRGDPADALIEDALGRLKRLVMTTDRASPLATYLSHLNSESLSLVGADQAVFDGSKPLPALQSTVDNNGGTSVQFELCDGGADSPTGRAVYDLGSLQPSHPTLVGGVRSSVNSLGVNDLPNVNYANRDRLLEKLWAQIESLSKENAELEAESVRLAEETQTLEKEAVEVTEHYWAARSAGSDIDRLSNLKHWFETTVAERAATFRDLQERALLGPSDEAITADEGLAGDAVVSAEDQALYEAAARKEMLLGSASHERAPSL